MKFSFEFGFFKPTPLKRHHYEFRFYYKKHYRNIFDGTFTIGLVNQSDVLNRRALKQQFNFYKEMNHVKHLFCNGDIHLEVICYLGYF